MVKASFLGNDFRKPGNLALSPTSVHLSYPDYRVSSYSNGNAVNGNTCIKLKIMRYTFFQRCLA